MVCLSVAQMLQITPLASPERVAELLPEFEAACERWGITTPQRLAAWVAQWAQETGSWRWREEIWGPTPQQAKYERPIVDGKPAPEVTTDDILAGARMPLWQVLGNFEQGDGKRFKGRGPPMLTGRANYGRATLAIGVDLLQAPELAARDDVGFEVAGWYWRHRKINGPADAMDLAEVTRRVNGGLTHFAERTEFYLRACAVLGIPTPEGAAIDDAT